MKSKKKANRRKRHFNSKSLEMTLADEQKLEHLLRAFDRYVLAELQERLSV